MASLFQMQGATGSGGDPVVIVTSLYFCLNLFFSFRSVFLCMYVRSRHDKLLTHLGSVVVSFFVLIVS